MRILDLASKDISQIVRDRQSLLFLLLMPLVFTFFMGFAYRSGGAAGQDARLPVGWLNQDPGGLLSTRLESLLAGSGAVRLEELEPTPAAGPAEAVRSGDLAAALIVPPGFSQETLAGKKMRLTLIAGEGSSEGQAARQAVRVAVVRLLSAAEIARLSSGADAQQFVQALDTAVQGWQSPLLNVVTEPVRAPAKAGDADFWANPYNQASPGMLVQFTLFGLVSVAMILVQERKARTLQRMLTTSMRRPALVAGHRLAMFTLVFAQELVLVIFGQLAFDVNYLRQPAATLLMMVAMGLWIASLGLLIGLLARAEEQVIIFALIGMFVFTSLAGAWFPLEATGPVFNTIGHLTPGAWAMDGFQNILIRGQGFSSVLLPAAVVLGYALLFFAIAAWRMRKLQA